jgi:hypothetical protein
MALQTTAMTTSAKVALLVPRDRIELPSLPCKSRALPLDERGINLAGPRGVEPLPLVSKTRMIIHFTKDRLKEKPYSNNYVECVRPYCLATQDGFEPPTFGFGDQRSAGLNY